MKNYTKIVIVENEILIANFILKLLNQEGFTSVEVAHDAHTAEALFNSFQPDIILLDINLEGSVSGIDLASKINQDAKIIYLTAQNDPETIKKAIETNPETYLTKPIKKSDILAAIHLSSFKNTKKHLLIKDGYATVKLFQEEIIYIKSDNIYLDIVTTSKKYTVRNSLDNLLQELDSQFFFKAHRSYIINKKWLTKKTKNTVYLGDVAIPISRSFSVEF